MSISGYRSRIMYALNFGDHLVFLGNESILCMNKFGTFGKQLNTTHLLTGLPSFGGVIYNVTVPTNLIRKSYFQL
jgi:hypothetical protein